MEERKIGLDKARPILGDLADGAARRGEITILTSHGHPLARIVPLGKENGTEPGEGARRFAEQERARRVAALGEFRVEEWESLIAEEPLTPDRVFNLMHDVFRQGLGGGFPGVPA